MVPVRDMELSNLQNDIGFNQHLLAQGYAGTIATG